MGNNENQKENTNYWPLILLSIGVVLLYFLSWFLIGHFINNPETQGQFGDQFGAVNALFSVLPSQVLSSLLSFKKRNSHYNAKNYLTHARNSMVKNCK